MGSLSFIHTLVSLVFSCHALIPLLKSRELRNWCWSDLGARFRYVPSISLLEVGFVGGGENEVKISLCDYYQKLLNRVSLVV